MPFKAKDVLRYGRIEDIFKLVMMMQSSTTGISLRDICQEIHVSRRTAERLRDSILRAFPAAEEAPTDNKQKRWRIPSGVINRFISFQADDLALLQKASKFFQLNNMEKEARELSDLFLKISAFIKSDHKHRIETDLEALMDATSFIRRPGPKYIIKLDIIKDITHAILAYLQIEIEYFSREKRKTSLQTVNPYGFLYGDKQYLVAYNEYFKDYVFYFLPYIRKVKVTKNYFPPNVDFSMDCIVKDSFGIFREKPIEVVLRFDEDAAEDVRSFVFHPSQKIEGNKDGSVTVRFKAGGQQEMCWHFVRWGRSLKILKPKSLEMKYKDMLKECLHSGQTKKS